MLRLMRPTEAGSPLDARTASYPRLWQWPSMQDRVVLFARLPGVALRFATTGDGQLLCPGGLRQQQGVGEVETEQRR